MKLETYVPLARRTMKEMPFALHQEHMGLGVIGEIGEFADAVKKFFVYGKGVDATGKINADGKASSLSVADGGILDKVNLSEEGGDCFWYVVGYLPENEVDVKELQAGFDMGYALGAAYVGSSNGLVLEVMATISKAAHDLSYPDLQPLSTRTNAIAIMGRSLGKLYGHFNLVLDDSLDRNIAKLAKRYGDKYSDVAALTRDIGAERAVLQNNVTGVSDLNVTGTATYAVPTTAAGAVSSVQPMGKLMDEEDVRRTTKK